VVIQNLFMADLKYKTKEVATNIVNSHRKHNVHLKRKRSLI